jgi:hypothetical protein
MSDTKRPTEVPAWKALNAHYEKIKGVHLRQLFATMPLGPKGSRRPRRWPSARAPQN